MADTLTYEGQLVVTTCWCGIAHAVPEALYDHMKAQKRDGLKQPGVYCPLGHVWVISGEGEAEKLRKELERERSRRARIAAERDQMQASLSATRGVVTRMKKRASAGVCPCCNRSFENVRRHMANRHPDYALDAVEGTS